MWGEGKQDVTGAACGAVCEYVLANGEPVMVTCNGKPKYEITVRELCGITERITLDERSAEAGHG